MVESLALEYPDGIADVGAGGNFTVAVAKVSCLLLVLAMTSG